MSLLLCRQEPVETPYYMEELGIHLYSSQELCYVIYHYPMLVMDGFVDDRLIHFLRNELRLPFLAERVELWLQNRGASDELLFQILADCAYYTPQEQTGFRQRVAALRRLSPEEYEKKRADYFYELQLYGKAISVYGKILEKSRETELSADLKGRVWNNIAACYARLFCYQKAMHAYACAYEADPRDDYLKKMYFLTLRVPAISLKEKLRVLITEEKKAAWDLEYSTLLAACETPPGLSELDAVFSKDPVKRIAGAGDILNRWKAGYRRMV